MIRHPVERRSVVDLIAENRRGVLIVAAIVIVVILAATGIFDPNSGSNGDRRSDGGTQSTSDTTMRAIADPNTSCSDLQDIFDAAEAIHQDADDLAIMQRMTGYMSAADHEMSEDGCYE